MKNVVMIDDRFTVAKCAPTAETVREAPAEGFKSVVNMRTENEK